MAELLNQSCEACKIGTPTLSNEEINNLMSEITDWNLITEPINQLKKVFNFNDYQSGVTFLNSVANMADAEDHHPEITLEWGKVTILWWSHKIQGLHKNDFICASKTDSLYLEN